MSGHNKMASNMESSHINDLALLGGGNFHVQGTVTSVRKLGRNMYNLGMLPNIVCIR